MKRIVLAALALALVAPSAGAQAPTPTEKAILAELVKVNKRLDGFDTRLGAVEKKLAAPAAAPAPAPAPAPAATAPLTAADVEAAMERALARHAPTYPPQAPLRWYLRWDCWHGCYVRVYYCPGQGTDSPQQKPITAALKRVWRWFQMPNLRSAS